MLIREIASNCQRDNLNLDSINISSHTTQELYFHDGAIKSRPGMRFYSVGYVCNNPASGESEVTDERIAAIQCNPLTDELQEVGDELGLSALSKDSRLIVDYRIAKRVLMLMGEFDLSQVTLKYGKSGTEVWDRKKAENILYAGHDIKVHMNNSYVLG